jgi:hypothetical protein
MSTSHKTLKVVLNLACPKQYKVNLESGYTMALHCTLELQLNRASAQQGAHCLQPVPGDSSVCWVVYMPSA